MTKTHTDAHLHSLTVVRAVSFQSSMMNSTFTYHTFTNKIKWRRRTEIENVFLKVGVEIELSLKLKISNPGIAQVRRCSNIDYTVTSLFVE